MKKHVFKVLFMMILVGVLAACGGNGNGGDKQAAGEEQNGGSGAEEKLSFAFLPNTQNNTFQTAMTETYERLAKENGVEFTMLDPDYDLNKQMNQMADAANQGFDAVFVIPVDSAGIRQGLEQLKEKNIPVFNVDTAVIEEDRELVESVIATDAYMAGKLMGEQMVKDYPDGGQIAILDFPSNESCVQRVAGFMDGLGDSKDKFEIVAQQDGKAALDASLPIAEDIIQANPDIDAFFAINDPSALGVAAAIEASGKDNIGVYSIDASPDGKAALVDGSFTAVAAQVPIQIAEKSFQAALDLLDGKEIEKEMLLPSHVVTKEMAEETAGKWQ
ncbi:MAG TPA: sugar ABC transporter substrate-binding protein [Paenibacillus sp.]|uniref:sugar ABC transporter substrate-binding protein n=1 Tax=Paenibacillus sp. TaxID=58172 RepID=UPI002B6023E4|nr:sugar ABC transporter substrate-binding protein [Paenibacillus sp.]HUC92406.1 sugar ABC transporter substrate-binding protein [Paenibacillus sp.]